MLFSYEWALGVVSDKQRYARYSNKIRKIPFVGGEMFVADAFLPIGRAPESGDRIIATVRALNRFSGQSHEFSSEGLLILGNTNGAGRLDLGAADDTCVPIGFSQQLPL